MGISLQEIVDRAHQAAGAGVDPFKNPVIDSGMTCETLLPHALLYTVRNSLRSGEHLANVTVTHELTLIDGKTDLPAGVLREYLDHALLPQYGKRSSRYPYSRYIGTRPTNLVCGWSVRDGVFYSDCEEATVQHELIRVLPGVLDGTGDVNIDFTNLDGDMAAGDEGKRILLLSEDGDTLADTLVDVVTDANNFSMEDAPDPATPFTDATARLYEPNTTGLLLTTPTLPIFTDATTEVDMAKTFADDTIAVLALALSGKIRISDLLDASR